MILSLDKFKFGRGPINGRQPHEISIYNQSKLIFYKNYWLFGLSLDKFKFGRRPQIFLNCFRVKYTISNNVRKQCF